MNTRLFEDKESLISFLNSKVSLGNIFRGYSKKEELLPQIFRLHLFDHERDLLNDFEKFAKLFSSPTNAQEFYFICQHFGLPTRLLDFTYNPFVALFFAINKDLTPEDDTYKIFVLEKEEYTSIEMTSHSTLFQNDIVHRQTLNIIQFDSYTDEILGWFHKRRIVIPAISIITPSSITNQRIFSQQGVFYVALNPEHYSDPDYLLNSGFLIQINKNLRPSLLSYLSEIGIDSLHLLPGLDTLALDLKNKYLNLSRKQMSKK